MEAFIGTIQLFGFNFAPNGWLSCEGQLLPIAQYTPLFALIGVQFGGDGTQTFALPDYRALEQSLKGARYCICINGIFPSRP